MTKKSALHGILNAKCPRCRKGDLFTHPLFNLSKMASMPTHCANCGLRYEKEPGYFYGAMYVSYAFSTGIFLVVSGFLYFFMGDPSLIVYLTTVPAVALILFPINYRYSRVLFLYMVWKT